MIQLPNIKALCLVVSDKKIFSCCSLYKPIDVNYVTPGVGPFLAPGVYFEQT